MVGSGASTPAGPVGGVRNVGDHLSSRNIVRRGASLPNLVNVEGGGDAFATPPPLEVQEVAITPPNHTVELISEYVRSAPPLSTWGFMNLQGSSTVRVKRKTMSHAGDESSGDR